jgi:hypothetical protein
VAERYGEIVEALYRDVDEVTIRTFVTYQDGTRVERPITLRISSMDGFVAPTPTRRRRLALLGPGAA